MYDWIHSAKYAGPYRDARNELETAKRKLEGVKDRAWLCARAGIEFDFEGEQAAAQAAYDAAKAKADELWVKYNGGEYRPDNRIFLP